MNLGRASREELIQLVSQLLDHVEALEARISELEGRQKPPTEGGKERKPPSWAKANRPDRPKKERRNRAHGFARRREEPTHRVEHATASCPDCGVNNQELPAIGMRNMLLSSEANIELKGNKQLLIDLGYPPDKSCATCGKAVASKNSRFCNRGHDNHFLSAMLANPKSGPLIREALQVYFANPLPAV